MTALEDLEALDQRIQQVFSLLTQADQAIEQVLQISSDWATAHGEHIPSAPLLHQALRDIQTNIHAFGDQHNQLAAHITQARTEAQQAPDANP